MGSFAKHPFFSGGISLLQAPPITSNRISLQFWDLGDWRHHSSMAVELVSQDRNLKSHRMPSDRPIYQQISRNGQGAAF